MISLDFYLTVSIFFVFFILWILFFWLFGKKEKDKDLGVDPKFIWHCSICAYTYISTKEEEITNCPRCGSFNKR